MAFEKFTFETTAKPTKEKRDDDIVRDVMSAVETGETQGAESSLLPANPDSEENLWPAQHDPRKGEPANIAWKPAEVGIPAPERKTL